MKDTWIAKLLIYLRKKSAKKMMANGAIGNNQLEGIAELANGKFFRGIGKLLKKSR